MQTTEPRLSTVYSSQILHLCVSVDEILIRIKFPQGLYLEVLFSESQKKNVSKEYV